MSDRKVRLARSFCRESGTRISALDESNPEIVPISVGTLDDSSALRPMAHIWTA